MCSGAFFMPGALPLNAGGLKPYCFGTNIHRMFSKALATPRPLRLSDFLQKSRPGRSSDDDFLCQIENKNIYELSLYIRISI